MNLASALAIYFIIWWLVLFLVLPNLAPTIERLFMEGLAAMLRLAAALR